MLYSMYSTPNLILPIFSGILIDKMGLRISVLFFMSFCLLGQFIFALGGSMVNFNVMLLGRFVYGLGCESAFFAQVAFSTKWFMEDGNLNFALGVVNSIPLLGSTFNGLFTPKIYGSEDDPHLGRALFTGFAFCLVCYLCLLVLVFIDYKAD
jgi:MFS family permease